MRPFSRRRVIVALVLAVACVAAAHNTDILDTWESIVYSLTY